MPYSCHNCSLLTLRSPILSRTHLCFATTKQEIPPKTSTQHWDSTNSKSRQFRHQCGSKQHYTVVAYIRYHHISENVMHLYIYTIFSSFILYLYCRGKMIRIFIFGDYEFLSRLFGISGHSGMNQLCQLTWGTIVQMVLIILFTIIFI